MMKIIKHIINLILSFLLLFIVAITIFINILENNILNKNYIFSKMEEINYYSQISQEVMSGFQNYIYQSGLPEETINDLYTDEMIKNDINSIVNYVYEGSEISLSDQAVRQTLDNKIQQYLNSEGKELNNQGKENIKKFEDLIVQEYKSNVILSTTLYEKSNQIITKLQEYDKIISNKPLIILSIVVILLIILNIKNLLIAINYISISFLSLGTLMLMGVNLLFKNFDIDNIKILVTSFTNLVINIIREILYSLSDFANLFFFAGIIGIITYAILNNIELKSKKENIESKKPKRRSRKVKQNNEEYKINDNAKIENKKEEHNIEKTDEQDDLDK